MAKSKKQVGTKVGQAKKNAPPKQNVVDESPEELSVVFESRNSPANSSIPIIKRNPKSMAKKAGIVFQPLHFIKLLKKGNYANNIRKGAGIYMAAAIEYLVAEVMELAGTAAKENKRVRIKPRDIMLAVRNDEELNTLLSHVTFSEGGVIPKIHAVLLPKKTLTKAAKQAAMDESQEPAVEKQNKSVSAKKAAEPAAKAPKPKKKNPVKKEVETQQEVQLSCDESMESDDEGEQVTNENSTAASNIDPLTATMDESE